jgi:acyl carrier protein
MAEVSLSALPAFLRNLEELLHLPGGSLKGEEQLRSLEAWDSMAIVEFMAMVDEKYSVTLSPAQFRRCSRTADLFALLSEQ